MDDTNSMARRSDQALLASLPEPQGVSALPGDDPSRWQDMVAGIWREIDVRADRTTLDHEEDVYWLGKREGFEQAVSLIDELTGGDGEYRYCTNQEPGRHCPDPEAMILRIVARLSASDSDEHRHGENAKRSSGEAMPARAEGIAQVEDGGPNQ